MSLEEAIAFAKDHAAGRISEIQLLDGTYAWSATPSGRRQLQSGDPESQGSVASFNASFSASKIVVAGAGDAAVLDSGAASSPLFTVQPGAPLIVFRHLTFTKGSGAQPVAVQGGAVDVEDCTFISNPAGALLIDGGDVRVRTSNFTANGLLDDNITSALLGAAIHALGSASILVENSTFHANAADEGGAIYITGHASLQLSSSTLSSNTARTHGGALAVAGAAHVALSNQTILSRNSARVAGRTAYLAGSSSTASYVLPAPKGHWLSNTVDCNELQGDDGNRCPVDATLTKLLAGALNDDFPFTCAPGLIGNSLSVHHQNNPDCSGSCPSGSYCPAGSVDPILCETSTYCGAGSSAETPCAPGTFGDRPGLKSQDECEPCPEGDWCRGGRRYQCPVGTWSNRTELNEVDACKQCPAFATTLAPGANSSGLCVCLAGYYDERPVPRPDEPAHCVPCRLGMDCSSDGSALPTIKIRKGFFRPSPVTDDVRQCLDARPNCSGEASPTSRCSASTSACSGGDNSASNGLCAPTLAGPFCKLCDSVTNVSSDGSAPLMHYVEATSTETAHCKPCETNLIGRTVGLGFGLLGVGVLLLVLLRAMSLRLPEWLVVWFRERLATLNLNNKLKVLIGFYQIATKVAPIYQVALPSRVHSFLSSLEVGISLNLDSIEAPLTCLGLGGYLTRLQFFMALPISLIAIVLVTTAVMLRCVGQRVDTRVAMRDQLLENSVPIILRIMFLAYPIVTTTAFAAWPCYSFAEVNSFAGASYLITDVAIDCGSSRHHQVQAWAIVAVCLYPVGVLALCTALLLVVRRPILLNRPTPLSRAVHFLYREYKPNFFWWELVEMARRFFLVGFFSLYPSPGSLAQIVTGTLLCAIYLFIQQQASPFASISDDYTAKACSFCLLLLFACSTLFNLIALLEQPELASLLSTRQRALVDLPRLSEVCLAAVAGAIVVTAGIVVVQIREEHLRRLRDAKAALARRLRIVRNSKEAYVVPITQTAAMKALDTTGFHLFLSHVWGTGQDQMRIVKQRLGEMLPEAGVFLDVDDLKTGRGAEYVDISNMVLVFVSKGYFSSPNCMREFLRATFNRTPVIALTEPEERHGSMTMEQVAKGLEEACSNFRKWGLTEEMVNWGFAPPSPQQLFDALFAVEPIEWNRIGAFQDVTMRLIAERILPPAHPKTYVQGELVGQATTLQAPRRGRRFHCYVSPHNRGGRELMIELSQANDWSVSEEPIDPLNQPTAKRGTAAASRLALTQEFAQLRDCDFMLVYLTARTWTSGRVSASFGEEVIEAMDSGVQLLLAHEMPGVGGQEARDGVEFGTFFSCDEGATPDQLLRAGIYEQIAVALKGGAWREASTVMLARTIAAYKEEELSHPFYWIGGSRRFGGSSSSGLNLWGSQRLALRKLSSRMMSNRTSNRSQRASVNERDSVTSASNRSEQDHQGGDSVRDDSNGDGTRGVVESGLHWAKELLALGGMRVRAWSGDHHGEQQPQPAQQQSAVEQPQAEAPPKDARFEMVIASSASASAAVELGEAGLACAVSDGHETRSSACTDATIDAMGVQPWESPSECARQLPLPSHLRIRSPGRSPIRSAARSAMARIRSGRRLEPVPLGWPPRSPCSPRRPSRRPMGQPGFPYTNATTGTAAAAAAKQKPPVPCNLQRARFAPQGEHNPHLNNPADVCSMSVLSAATLLERPSDTSTDASERRSSSVSVFSAAELDGTPLNSSVKSKTIGSISEHSLSDFVAPLAEISSISASPGQSPGESRVGRSRDNDRSSGAHAVSTLTPEFVALDLESGCYEDEPDGVFRI